MVKEIVFYTNSKGEAPFAEWFNSMRDHVMRHRIEARIDRIREGNYGDHKRFYGIIEVRMNFGKGYRLYCAEYGNTIVILLLGGDKASQTKDIGEALKYWRDYEENEA